MELSSLNCYQADMQKILFISSHSLLCSHDMKFIGRGLSPLDPLHIIISVIRSSKGRIEWSCLQDSLMELSPQPVIEVSRSSRRKMRFSQFWKEVSRMQSGMPLFVIVTPSLYDEPLVEEKYQRMRGMCKAGGSSL